MGAARSRLSGVLASHQIANAYVIPNYKHSLKKVIGQEITSDMGCVSASWRGVNKENCKDHVNFSRFYHRC